MRCTQLIGLKKEASKFLFENTKRVPCSPCPHCGKDTRDRMDTKIYESAASAGMFDDGPELNEYYLKDGRVIREVIQAVPWSSGPCIFMCLIDAADPDGKWLFPWSDEEIDNA